MKSGFVVLAGRSNVGKSTLINALVGTKVAIVTPKPQTTRHPVRGILHDERGQIVFVDTPGVFLGKKDAVSQRLNQIVKDQLEGIDVIVYVMDPTRASGPEEENIQTLLRGLPIPCLLVMNKADLPTDARPYTEEVKNTDIGQKHFFEISALKGKGLKELIDYLFAMLPEGEAFYPEHQMTDLAHKEWVEEVIREKLFLYLQEELPYTIKVEVTDVQKRKNNMEYVAATIWTTDDHYKGMIIGHRGSMLKDVGAAARKELELAMDQKVFLDLIVDVDPKWQERFV